MATIYEYTSIGSFALSTKWASYENAVVRSLPAVYRLTANGQAYDMQQGASRPIGVAEITLRGGIYGSSAANMATDVDGLLALHNTTQTVTRTRTSGGSTQTATCRILVDWDAATREHTLFVPFTVRMVPVARTQFFGTTRNYSAESKTTGYAESLTNSGNDQNYDAIITLSVASGTVTDPTFTIGSAEMKYTGTLSGALTITCGALTATVGGSSVLDDWAPTSNHAVTEWLPIPTGSNSLTLTFTGGGAANMTVAYKDAYRL